ncbi:hypothetical protein THH46_05255 [Pseudomonas sp. NA13]
MPITVVQRLEPVQVNKRNRHLLLINTRLAQRLTHPLSQQQPIGQLRERVIPRVPLQQLQTLLHLRHVAEQRHIVLNVTVPVMHRTDADPRRHLPAILVVALNLTGPMAVEIQRVFIGA